MEFNTMRYIPQYQSIRHGMTAREFLQEHKPRNPNIVIVGYHRGKIYYDGNVDEANGDGMDKAVRFAHPDLKKYAYFGDYHGADAENTIYKIVVEDNDDQRTGD